MQYEFKTIDQTEWTDDHGTPLIEDDDYMITQDGDGWRWWMVGNGPSNIMAESDCCEQIRADMDRQQFWPNIWLDHGERGDYSPVMIKPIQTKKNAERARQAKAMLIPAYPDTDALDEQVIDALTNLRHLCDRDEMDFARLDRCADMNYTAEVEGYE